MNYLLLQLWATFLIFVSINQCYLGPIGESTMTTKENSRNTPVPLPQTNSLSTYDKLLKTTANPSQCPMSIYKQIISKYTCCPYQAGVFQPMSFGQTLDRQGPRSKQCQVRSSSTASGPVRMIKSKYTILLTTMVSKTIDLIGNTDLIRSGSILGVRIAIASSALACKTWSVVPPANHRRG